MPSFNMHYTKDVFGAIPIESKLSCSRSSFLLAILYFVSVAVNNVLPMAGRGEERLFKEK